MWAGLDVDLRSPATPPPPPTAGEAPPAVELRALDTLWFQVGGTLCNLACTHCFVSCSPTNHTHEMMRLEQVRGYLREAAELGVKEYYFTGGEPFLNPDMEAILEAALAVGPATVLTNGLLLDAGRCARLAALAGASPYSLDLRVSLDGYEAESNDAVRGAGTFERVLAGLRNLAAAGLNPVVTVTEVCGDAAGSPGSPGSLDSPGSSGSPGSLGSPGSDTRWDHLQCSSCRMVTDQGVWVCPILVNEPEARMGDTLAEALGKYPLRHAACWTCHVYGVSCRT